MEKKLYSRFEFGDMRLLYFLRDDVMTMTLVPAGYEDKMVEKSNCAGEPLVQAHIAGDIYGAGFTQGRSLRGGQTTQSLKFISQKAEQMGETTQVVTLLRDKRGLEVTHAVNYRAGTGFISVHTALTNGMPREIALELLTSFTLGDITPFAADKGHLQLTRLLSCWSNEGQVLSQSAEEMQIEPAWAPALVSVTRFGQVGSMPVRGWAPVAGVTDRDAGVTWGCRLTHAYSWQMEMARQDDGLCLTGGIADREFGHFLKKLAPGETFETPEALLTVTDEGFDEACFRTIRVPDRPAPVSERDLPSLFNEYCTTWGVPSAENIAKIAKAIRGHGFRYFVIDAGWYAQQGRNWYNSAGDWEVSDHLFPEGLDAALAEIRKNGMIPGIWFELEVASDHSDEFRREEMMLKRDGYPITVGQRRFLDFTRPDVRTRMREKVIGFLRRHEIGYIKVDYNETIGIGADGCESQGEKLRRHIEAVQDFFAEMRRELPDLTIEICSSGGHRLVTSFLEIGDMASFSDAHECPEIPVVAKNVLRLAEMRKSQIWAVIHKEQTLRQIIYKLTGGMLGRICISGDVTELTGEQWQAIDRGLAFQEQSREFMTGAKTRFYGSEIVSARTPRGWQAVERALPGKKLLVVHSFPGAPAEIRIPCTGSIEAIYAAHGVKAEISGGELVIAGMGEFDGAALRIED